MTLIRFSSRSLKASLWGGALALSSTAVAADPVLRHQVDQPGDFLLIGNTLAQDCGSTVPSPIVGTVEMCGSFVNDGSPDVFWRADSPTVGQAEANNLVDPAAARSSAHLEVPAGATVTYSRLYWSSKTPSATADLQITLERAGVFSQTITADDSWFDSTNGNFYQATAEVTSIIQQHAAGVYRVAEVETAPLLDSNDQVAFSSWALVTFYSDSNEPPRNLTLFDGFDRVANKNPAPAKLSGFLVPNSGFDAKLGVIAYEGDVAAMGDELRFGSAPLTTGDRLSDALNPEDNFFNSTRSWLGQAKSEVGDLPELVGTAGSLSGFDLDVIDVTSKLSPGQSSVDIEASSTGDVFFLGGFVTSISRVEPSFTVSSKTAIDVNGAELLVGDEIQYEITVTNTGNDTSVGTVLTDSLPSAAAYVPNSLMITAGANVGGLTDAMDQDEGEVTGSTVTVRLGSGANSSSGGALMPGESTTLQFRVVANEVGDLINQAMIMAGGQQGAPVMTTLTDGDSGQPDTQPTISLVHACSTDVDCSNETPACDSQASPHLCVECLTDLHCPTSKPVCDSGLQVCGPCSTDDQCGAPDSGLICSEGECVPDSPINDGGCSDGAAGADSGLCEDSGSGGVGAGGSGGGSSGQAGADGGEVIPSFDGGIAGEPNNLARYEGSGLSCAWHPAEPIVLRGVAGWLLVVLVFGWRRLEH